jgi:hypothetical protein
MSIEVISFALGAILIATAVIGGGFEIREIRMPPVGAGVRVVSLLVGCVFVVLGLSLWGADRPHLAQVEHDAPAPASEPAAGNLAPQAEETSIAPGAVQALRTVPPPAGFTGFVGDSRLYWDFEGIRHHAAMQTNGGSGWVRVSVQDPGSGAWIEVDQDLVLVADRGVPVYQGSNPRFAGTATPYLDYSPDSFRVVEVAHGQWTIDATCDELQRCSAVTVVGP